MIVFGQAIGEWVAQRTGGEFVDGIAIGYARDNQLKCGVVFEQYIEGRSIRMHVAADEFNREFLRYIFSYAFDYLKVNKIIGNIDSTNHASKDFALRIGATLEHTIEGASRLGDMCIFTLTRQNCRFLGKKNVIKE